MKRLLCVVVSVMFAVSFLITPANANGLPVKNAWLFGDENIFSLTQNGELYYGEDIYSQNKELILKNVDSVLFRENGENAYVLLGSSDIVRIPTDYRFDKNNIENNLNYFKNTAASKLLEVTYNSECLFLNEHKELMMLNQFGNISKIYDNVKSVYSIGDDEYIILLNDDKLILYQNGNVLPILDNVESFNYISSVETNYYSTACILTHSKELYFFKYSSNDILPTKIATNVKKILNTYHKYIPYIDNENNLYVYNIEQSTTKLMMKNAKDGFYSYPFYYIIGQDNNLYIDKTNSYSEKYNPTVVQKDIKELLYSIDKRYFFNSTKGNLYVGYKPDGAAPKLVFLSTGLNNIVSVSGKNGYGIGSCDYAFVSGDGCVYGADYLRTEVKKPIHTIYCEKPLKIFFDNKEIILNLKVQTINNRTMYPFRECLENFGATVLWDAVNNSAIGKLNGVTVEFPIGKKEYFVNGICHEMDIATYIDKSVDRTYIPIRYAAEGMGFTVDWLPGDDENIISIYK